MEHEGVPFTKKSSIEVFFELPKQDTTDQKCKITKTNCLLGLSFCPNGFCHCINGDYTRNHSIRVREYSQLLGEELGLESGRMNLLLIAASFHDIGKVGIDDFSLRKPTRLNEKDFIMITQHPIRGEMIASKIAFLKPTAKIIRHHHERYDGKGYPDGLKGKEIPFESRIIAIADTFDALISDRPYRKRMGLPQAFETLEMAAGLQLDPDMVAAFLRLWKEGFF